MGWGRTSGTADLSAASSAEASAKAEASGGGVCGFPPPQPSPARAGEGAQRRKRRYETDLGNAGLVSFCRETPTFLLGHVSCPIKPAQTDGGSRHSPSILTRFLMRFREAPVGTMQRSQ